MAKALYISVGGEGHINPTLALVRDLVSRGEQIVYYSSDGFKKKIEETGAEFRPVNQEAQRKLHESTALSYSNPKEYMLQFLSALEMITDSILEDISKETYDYLLYDAQTLPGIWVAYKSKLLSVATWTTFAYSLDPSVNMELTEPGDVKRKQESMAMLAAFFQIEEIAHRKRHLENKYGVPLKGNFLFSPGAGNLNIVFTSSLFQRNSFKFGEHFTFVGPSFTEGNNKNDFPIHKLEGKPVILISMGTIVNKQLDLYKKCLEAFKNFGGKVVLSIGKELSVEELGHIPDNFIVCNHVPQIDILRYTDVFITHAGMNSTSEALYYEVPLVMIPLMNDQYSIAQRVKELGAGSLLDIQHLSVENLKEAVGEVFNNPNYKENAIKISSSFRNAGGYVKAADEIITFTRL
ncbi:macrolide family glycosyltransferase [Clostridium sp. OS1-26]|uniref:macrolide family glycosyltransferase n=1 Tax=Clostridium sp. OS1-26 TaxID=3070681 RepID=UPI0027E199F0|nr:macrolide family glycosyltransferase [Clostridium sp. OS1-26]WML32864.1 glycosyltransferase [Clostridium sp. OS1-26]